MIIFGKRSVKSKIVIIITLLFAFFIVTSLIYTIIKLDVQEKKEIKEYRETQKNDTEEELKSFVYMAYTVVENNYKNATDTSYLKSFYGPRLKNFINIVEEILKDKANAVSNGKLNLAQAQAQALELIGKIKYDKGAGYIWVIDSVLPNPTMILEPTMPELKDKVLTNEKFNYVSGTKKNVFTEIAKKCKNDGEGFVDYVWSHPLGDSTQAEIPKFAYSRLFEEWGWIICTGIYIDNAIKDSMEKTKSDLRRLRYANGTGYFWLNDDTEPIPKLIMNPFIPDLEGKVLTGKKYNRAFDKDYNLYKAFHDACKKTGEGFVEYKWDKPAKNELIEDAQKTSFVKFFEPFGWVIGSGVYIDDIEKEINKKVEKMRARRINLIISYLSIFTGLGTASIGFLIYILNRLFKKTKEEENIIKKENKITEDLPPDIVTEKIENEESTKQVNDPIEPFEKLLKIFMTEHTKLLAVQKTIDNNNYHNITKEVQKLVKDFEILNEKMMNEENHKKKKEEK